MIIRNNRNQSLVVFSSDNIWRPLYTETIFHVKSLLVGCLGSKSARPYFIQYLTYILLIIIIQFVSYRVGATVYLQSFQLACFVLLRPCVDLNKLQSGVVILLLLSINLIQFIYLSITNRLDSWSSLLLDLNELLINVQVFECYYRIVY